MTHDSPDLPHSSTASALREQALARLRESRSTRQPDDPQRMLHELQVQQIELEIQNETLIATQRQLESTLQQFSNLFDFAPIPYVRLDARGDILDANHAAAEFFGIDRTALGQRHLESLFPRDEIPAIRDFLTQCHQTGRRQSLETQVTHNDQPNIVLLQAVAEQGKSTLLLSMTDISHVRIMEQSASNLADSLGKPIDPRTDSLVTLSRNLKLNEERLNFSLRSSGVAIWEWDVQTGKVTFYDGIRVADQATQQLGSLTDWLSRVHPDEREDVMAIVDRGIQSDQPYNLEYRLLSEDGDFRWHRASGQVMERDATGTAIRVIGIYQDVHEQELLILHARRLATIVEASDDLIAMTRFDTTDKPVVIDYLNPAGHQILGIPSLDQPGTLSASSVFPSESLRCLREGSLESTGIKKSWQGEIVFDGPNGQTRTFSQLILTIYNQKTGQPEVLATICRDISERLRHEHELLTHRRMLETAEHLARVGAWTYDVANDVLTPSLEWLCIMGVNKTTLSLEDTLSLSHPEDRERKFAAIDNLLRHNQTIDLESRIIRRDTGEMVHVHTLARGIMDASGQVIEIQGATQDITQRRHLEQQVHEQLLQLEQSDRRKDEFLAILSHELRNPLTPLSIAAHLLCKGGLTDEKRDWCHQMIEQQSKHLTRLVDDLLDISRITRGKIELNRQCVDLTRLVKEAIQASQTQLGSAGLSLSLNMPPERIEVDADPMRLIQVLNNLLDNAAKFSPTGSRLTIGLQRQGSEALISVADTGIGLEPEALPRVFDLFTQINKSEHVSNSGMGIGLHLCKQLVELHGGSISVTSTGPGQGSEFLVCLPVRAIQKGRLEEFPANTEGPAHRILIVDDHPDVTESLEMLLRGYGHEVRVALSGPEALALAENFQPDLILLDIGMPGMDGYETCEILRRQPWTATIPIVALSGWGQVEDKQRALRIGFTRHLTKPLAPETFQRLLEELLPGQSSHQ